MVEKISKLEEKINRRTLGIHLTSKHIFFENIYPEIKDILYDYIWVDQYAGEGNLILPILDTIPAKIREKFFKKHIFLFDIQPEMVQKSIQNAKKYNIPISTAEKNIKQRDNLASFPKFLEKSSLPIFHITNPPYLYLGYIRKHKKTQKLLKYFENENEGYQDLYQIAMINDLRNNVLNLIYIIPSNFLFGATISNKFRSDFLKYYNILKIYIYETKIFEFTGTNICIGVFRRKNVPKTGQLKFIGKKYKKSNKILYREYNLMPKFKYRGGAEFNNFLERFFTKNPLKVKYYLLKEEVAKNQGKYKVKVIDTNNYNSNEYSKLELHVNSFLNKKLKSNILYVRTVDTGSIEGRVGLYEIKKDFNVNGIYVSKNTYRTTPIQIFYEPELKIEDQILLKEYFNFTLEYFRKKLDSEFLTTYKYSNAEYTRKYLGLTQVRKLIETFPVIEINARLKEKLKNSILARKFEDILKILEVLTKK